MVNDNHLIVKENGQILIDVEKKLLHIKEATKKGYTTIDNGDCFDMTYIKSKTRRGRNMKEKCNTLTATSYSYMRYEHPIDDSDIYYRKLTPLECMRLQTVPDDYQMPVSDSQKYKLLGNGWNIETIAHILKNMEIKT
tara:strand:- start:48 stop:461 length:414 start_codon:yes stop_codon:yes gene_type:complete